MSALSLLVPLLGQNELAVTRTPQAILFALVLDKYLVSMRKQGIAEDAPVAVEHAEVLVINVSFRNCK